MVTMISIILGIGPDVPVLEHVEEADSGDIQVVVVDGCVYGGLVDLESFEGAIIFGKFVLVGPELGNVVFGASEEEVGVAVDVEVAEVDVLFGECAVAGDVDVDGVLPVVAEGGFAGEAEIGGGLKVAGVDLEHGGVGHDDLLFSIVICIDQVGTQIDKVERGEILYIQRGHGDVNNCISGLLPRTKPLLV